MNAVCKKCNEFSVPAPLDHVGKALMARHFEECNGPKEMNSGQAVSVLVAGWLAGKIEEAPVSLGGTPQCVFDESGNALSGFTVPLQSGRRLTVYVSVMD